MSSAHRQNKIKKQAPPPSTERELRLEDVMHHQSDIYSTVAPWPGQDDGDAGRQRRGLLIAATSPITSIPVGYRVPSQSGNGDYVVSLGEEPFCSCPDWNKRRLDCKHIHAVRSLVQQETGADAPLYPIELGEPKYTQPWSLYNAAQTNEKSDFMKLLAQLCDSIQQPTQERGRPRALLADMVFAATYKVYSLFSSRRFSTDMREAHAQGYVSHPPHFNTICKYMSDPDLTPLLLDLVHASSLPVKHLETQFAVDSSGFSTCRFVSWYNKKHKRVQDNREWVKMHLNCGTSTHIVTEVRISGWEAHDTTFFESLLDRTTMNFNVEGISADKAYLSHHNLHLAMLAGAVPYIPFKSNTVVPALDDTSAWAEMYHFFRFRPEEFWAFYHRRSNVESTFSMIKDKFGDHLFSKSTAGQVNEAICKVLCHNLVEVSRALRYGRNPKLDDLTIAAI